MRFLRSSAQKLPRTLAAAALILLAPSIPLVASPGKTAPKEEGPSSYTITDLGDLPSVADDVALGLNDAGHVSLWTRSPAGTVHAALWSDSGTTDLGTLDGYQSSITRGIDEKNRAVGWVVSGRNLVDSQATMQGFLYDGAMHLLGTLGGKNSRALAMNANGDVVGEAQTATGDRHAFLLHNGKMTDLGTLPLGRMSVADCINNAGDIAGAADVGQGARQAVLWRKGKMLDLGALPNGKVTYATAINNKDQVVGFGQTPDGYHAFLWDHGHMTDLGTLQEDPSNAKGINNAGQVVGSSGVGHFTLHGYLWQRGKMVDLNTLIPSNSGWQITDAYAINNSGQIACSGWHNKTAFHALLLTPVSGDRSSNKGGTNAHS